MGRSFFLEQSVGGGGNTPRHVIYLRQFVIQTSINFSLFFSLFLFLLLPGIVFVLFYSARIRPIKALGHGTVGLKLMMIG